MTEELPSGWTWATLGDLTEIATGVTKDAKREQGTDLLEVPYLRVANVQRGELDLSDVSSIRVPQSVADRLRLVHGDLLLNEGGDRDKLGRGWVWQGEIGWCIHQNHVFRARPLSPALQPKYLSWYANEVGRAWFERHGRQTTNLASISRTMLSALPVALPPSEEQRRIVGAIEEQLSRLDNADRLIESALRRLPLIRRAVLSDVMPDPLPDSWKLLTVEEAGTVELGRQRSPKYHSGPSMKPYLRVANVHEDRIDLGDVKEMDFPPEQLARHELRPGDILLNEGQSPEFVGRPAMYRGEMPGVCFTNSLIRFRPFDFVNGEYALLVFLRHLLFGRFQREAQITTNIAHMAAGRLKRVEFPVPPLDEQHDIVEEARRQLSLLDAFGMELRTALRRSDSLRRAILAAAFRGELVPQDPADEPAADLLARIASERPAPTPRTRRKNGA